MLQRQYELVPLDTLTPIPGLTPDAPETDPLEGLKRLAVIQPRGLSPADNVALDAWVRAGGRLLLVLDPQLTGEYELPLGDPRRPNDTALVPPVLARWGLELSVNEESFAGPETIELGDQSVTVFAAGSLAQMPTSATGCEFNDSYTISQCLIGDGQVTVFADAAAFEDEQWAGSNGQTIIRLLDYTFGN